MRSLLRSHAVVLAMMLPALFIQLIETTDDLFLTLKPYTQVFFDKIDGFLECNVGVSLAASRAA